MVSHTLFMIFCGSGKSCLGKMDIYDNEDLCGHKLASLIEMSGDEGVAGRV